MRWDWRKDKKTGAMYASFTYYDTTLKRTVRLKKSEAPSDIDTEEKAKAFAATKMAAFETMKIRLNRRMEWNQKYQDFNELLQIFENHLERRGDRTWRNTSYYLSQYVYPFFLNEKHTPLIPDWPNLYNDFHAWLLATKKAKKSKEDLLSYSTRNHIISALNTFLDVMYLNRRVLEPVQKCRKFPAHLLTKKDLSSVHSEEEIEAIFEALLEISPASADFFYILANTGLRTSEALGISTADLFKGAPADETLQRMLATHGIECFGYLSITSQVDLPNKVRAEDKTVRRAPLKGRKAIGAREGRIVPLITKETFNILARRFNAEREKIVSNPGAVPNTKDVLLFDGLTKSIFTRHLAAAYSKLKSRFSYKSPHCLRHTFSTKFAGQTKGDFNLCRIVLGHRDEETTRGYAHLFEEIAQNTQTDQQLDTGMEEV